MHLLKTPAVPAAAAAFVAVRLADVVLVVTELSAPRLGVSRLLHLVLVLPLCLLGGRRIPPSNRSMPDSVKKKRKIILSYVQQAAVTQH